MHYRKQRFITATVAAVCAISARADIGDQLFKLLPADGAAGDNFGNSIALDGLIALVGTPRDDDNGADSGSAYLLDSATGQPLFKLLPGDGAESDLFGWSVAISGTTAIVGAQFNDDNGVDSGSAYLFNTITGQQLFKLLPIDGAAGDKFGISVAIYGTTAIVGAYQSDDNGADSGSAYLFDTMTGQQLAKLLPTGGATTDNFGVSVAINETTALVGADRDDDNGLQSGSAFLFDITTGQQLLMLLPNDGATGDGFGGAVAMNGTTAVVGANSNDDNGAQSGSAYLFDIASGQQLFKLLPIDGATSDTFGRPVAISGTTVIIGANLDDDNGVNSGSAYLFSAITGLQLFKLLPGDGAAGDRFGGSVAISGTTPIVGAALNDDNGANSGSAYVFDDGVPSIVQQPSCGLLVEIGDAPQSISVVAEGTPPLMYQWRLDGAPLADDGSYNGTTTNTLTIDPSPATEGMYTVFVTDVTGSVTSDPLLFAVRNPLPADINGDGVVDTADLGILIGQFGMMTP